MTQPDTTFPSTSSPTASPAISYPNLSRPTLSQPTVWLSDLSRWGVRYLPPIALQTGLEATLNMLFKTAATQGELDFLAGRTLCVAVTDIALTFTATLNRNRLHISVGSTSGDVQFSAVLSDLIQIAAGTADPDTLFFRRRLQVSGDTELGLAVKNFLGRFDAEAVLPGPLHRALQHVATQLQ